MSILDSIPLKGERAFRTGAVPVVLMTRIRLARNVRDARFPDWAREAQRAEIWARCRDALLQTAPLKDALALPVESLDELDREILVERHLISRELAGGKPHAGVCLNREQTCAVMVNEEDHLRIQVLRTGLQFKQAWKTASALDKSLEKRLDIAYSDELGYLTACPTNVGTGLRGSALMHLPGLVLGGQMEKVVRAVAQLGMTVRGLYGEGSEAHGSMFQISNQQTLGESESEILSHLEAVLGTIVAQEENARLRLLESEPEKLFDRIGRCYGTLRHAHTLTTTEALNFLSLMRLAVDLNAMPESKRGIVDRLFIEAQPGHLQALRGVMPPEKRDVARARLIRETFSKIEEPDFSKTGL